MPFNFRLPEFLSHSKLRKNQVSPVSRASPAHMNCSLESRSWLFEARLALTFAQLYKQAVEKFAVKIWVNTAIGLSLRAFEQAASGV